jgi:hypothetical protein
MELAKHVDSIVIEPSDGGSIRYKGKWDLLGDGGSMDGAEGGNWSQLPPALRLLQSLMNRQVSMTDIARATIHRIDASLLYS